MSKKAWFISIGCLIAGLAIGFFVGLIHGGAILADTLTLVKVTELTESGERAFQAYQHASKPIAIYALTQDLNVLQDQKYWGNNPFFSTPTEIQRRLMLNHTRLAKLLAEVGQTNASQIHIAEALKHAQETSIDPDPFARFSSVTNEAQLFEILAKFDSKETP